jgi:predicted fused transcriptional regulator/phosphomethylpyrimidine kinase
MMPGGESRVHGRLRAPFQGRDNMPGRIRFGARRHRRRTALALIAGMPGAAPGGLVAILTGAKLKEIVIARDPQFGSKKQEQHWASTFSAGKACH